MVHEVSIPFSKAIRQVFLADPDGPASVHDRKEPAAEVQTEAVQSAPGAELDRRLREERGALEQVLAALGAEIGKLESQRNRQLRELQRLAIELGVEIASYLIREKIEAGAYPLEAVVREALQQLGARKPVSTPSDAS